jgi:hypothetical protein
VLSGHGRPFVDAHGHVEGNRKLVSERLERVEGALAGGSKTALEIAPVVYDEPVTEYNAGWLLQETLCYLRHLELLGPEPWRGNRRRQ